MVAVRYKTHKHIKRDGRIFERKWHFGTKTQAKTYKASMQKQGYLVRIIPHKGVYTAYIAKRR